MKEVTEKNNSAPTKLQKRIRNSIKAEKLGCEVEMAAIIRFVSELTFVNIEHDRRSLLLSGMIQETHILLHETPWRSTNINILRNV